MAAEDYFGGEPWEDTYEPDLRLEANIEMDFVKACGGQGCMALKYQPDGSINWPDRLVLLGNGTDRVFWIELKRFGEEPRKGQLSRHRNLRSLGYHVYWCDNLADAIDFLELELSYGKS